jgi:hypothetical protein
MKVQYLKDYKDESVAPGFVFQKGWTAEHTDAEGAARVAAGVCVEIDQNARARRTGVVTTVCAS